MFVHMHKLKNCPVCSSHTVRQFITTPAQMHSKKEQFSFDQCNNCNFVFLNPRVPKKELKNYYTPYYLPYRGAKAWGKYEPLVENSFKKLDLKKLALVKQVHNLGNSSLILDIGCGQPTFLKACQEKTNCQAIGIDFSNEGWVKDEKTYKNLDLRVGEVHDLLKDLNPDVITMWHYLEHDYSPLDNLKYLKRISKPSTKLIIEVPNFQSSSREKFGKHWAGWHTPRHTSLFSPSNLEMLLNKSGWKLEREENYGTMDPYLLEWMSQMEMKGIEWDKNMEEEIVPFVLGMIKFLPQRLLQKKSSLGIMTVVASPI
jgi:2-polyprenyl-3-methyl-5-hydroxy-6-metoxy-1,4-benzoquinol methylase